MFCSNCGNNVPEGTFFCTNCGKAFDTQQTAQNTMQTPAAPEQAPKAKAQPVSQPAQPVYAPQNLTAVGTGWYFGMMLLFAVPVIGWILCLATAFTNKNPSKKNFAKAMLIWLVIGLILSIVMFFVIQWAAAMVMDYVNTYAAEMTGGMMGEIGSLDELIELMQQMENMEGLENMDLTQLEGLMQQ